jgi:hypothetical protein
MYPPPHMTCMCFIKTDTTGLKCRTFFFLGLGASAGASAFFSAAGAGAAASGAGAACVLEQGRREEGVANGNAEEKDTRDKRKGRQRGRTRVREKAADKSDRDECIKRARARAWHLLLLGLRSIRGGVSSLGCVGRGGSGSVGRRGGLRASK